MSRLDKHKNEKKYYVMPRSYLDPLADESPSMMLEATPASAPARKPRRTFNPFLHNTEEADKLLFGFYNYDQHLRDSNDTTQVRDHAKQQSEFAEVSREEIENMKRLYEEGKVYGDNITAFDAGDEYFEALEGEGEFEELEDDFVLKALEDGAPDDEGQGEEEGYFYEDEEDNDEEKDGYPRSEEGEGGFEGEYEPSERAPTVFTRTEFGVKSVYSMKSILRGESVPEEIFEEAFDQLAEEYEDDEIGELDGEESDPDMQGFVESLVEQYPEVLDEYIIKENRRYEESSRGGQADPNLIEGAAVVELARKAVERFALEDDPDISDEFLRRYYAPPVQRDEFDCESILSSRSSASKYIPRTIEVAPVWAKKKASSSSAASIIDAAPTPGLLLPKTIQPAQRKKEDGFPVTLLQKKSAPLSASELLFKARSAARTQLESIAEEEPGDHSDGDAADSASEDDEGASANVKTVDNGAARPKHETAEEKKARKAAIKEARRESRQRKKATKQLYKNK